MRLSMCRLTRQLLVEGSSRRVTSSRMCGGASAAPKDPFLQEARLLLQQRAATTPKSKIEELKTADGRSDRELSEDGTVSEIWCWRPALSAAAN
mmetsp:Transcript_77877/g.137316  ORF Transcript_77877/g.137316 Transcript_77877/m.137316 type:complete len:94 (-) Transcript_77877:32-313(-)